MEQFEGSGFRERHGFAGSVANLTLSDLLQFQAQKQYTGLVQVFHGGLEGDLYFQGGELTHAEVGGIWGEEAVYHILSWVNGEFLLQEGLEAPRRTVRTPLARLLLEYHQRLDEAANGGPEPYRPEPPLPVTRNLDAAGAKMSALSQKIVNAVPGARYAVLISEDGTPHDDPSTEAEAIAARAIYLVTMLASPISATFGLGELALAHLRSDVDPLVVFRNKDKFLVVLAEPDAPLDRVEAGVRRLFSTPRT